MSNPPSSISPQSRPSPAARWARETFSGESMLAGLKALAWLAPLTLLIWIYAERSQLVTTPPPGETIPIEVRSSDPNRFYVKLLMPVENDRSVVAQLVGPLAQIEQVIKKIAPENNNPSVIITIPASQSGVIELEAAKQLSLNPIFTNAGVSVINSKPTNLKVSIDNMVDDDAEVKVRPDQQNQISSPVFTPAKVRLRGPSQDINNAKAQGPLVVYADFDKSVLQQPGPQNDLTVRFQSEQFKGKPIAFSVTTVKASIDVRQSEFAGVVRSIPIAYRVLPDITTNFAIQITGDTKALSNVPVIGPEDKVKELVNASQIQAYAELPIKFGTDAQSAIPEIHLPDPLVRVDLANYTPKEITYTLHKRDQP
jgi:hypothetical protein